LPLTNQSRCLGLVGGLGVGATVYYYEKIVRGLETQGRVPDLVIAHAETPRVFEFVQTANRVGLAEYLNSYIRRLESAGAEIAVIPAVTAHFCMRELEGMCSLPVLSIFAPLNKALASRSVRRVTIFGTRFVLESALFGELSTVEVVKPEPQEVDYIHNTYVELARTGIASAEQHRGLTSMAHTLIDRDGVDAVILAGTDLALLFNETNTDFPYFDCAALHVQAILQELMNEGVPRHGPASRA